MSVAFVAKSLDTHFQGSPIKAGPVLGFHADNASATGCKQASDQFLFNFGNRFSRIQTFRTGIGAVHDGMTTI